MTTCYFTTDIGKVCLVKGSKHSFSESSFTPNPMSHGNSLIKRLQDDVDDDLLLHRGLREDSLGETEPTVFLRNINYTQINIFTFLRQVFKIARFCPARGGKSELMRRWSTVTPGDYAQTCDSRTHGLTDSRTALFRLEYLHEYSIVFHQILTQDPIHKCHHFKLLNVGKSKFNFELQRK